MFKKKQLSETTSNLTNQKQLASGGLSGYWRYLVGTLGDPLKTTKLLWLLVLSSLLTIASLIYLTLEVPKGTVIVKEVASLNNLTQQISRFSTEATTGGSDASIKQLTTTRDDFIDNAARLKAENGARTGHMKEILGATQSIADKTDYILQNQKVLNDLYDVGVGLRENIPKIQEQYNAILSSMAANKLPANQLLLAKDQIFLAEKMRSQIANIISAGGDAGVAGSEFSDTVQTFGQVLKGQMKGDAEKGIAQLSFSPDVVNRLVSINNIYEQSAKMPAQTILYDSEKIRAIREKATSVSSEATALTALLATVEQRASSLFSSWLPASLMVLGLLGIAFSVIRIFLMRVKSNEMLKDEQAQIIRNENRRNQAAISRLLDELEGLADGDLTTNATVSEDFTGAIADSINMAIDQLRQLVTAINDTTGQVTQSTSKTQAVAMQLADASEHQAQEIAGVSAAVNEMAVSIDNVSKNATESAAVAERSVGIAANGGELVQRGIEGMDTIRDQIQETSKRIKRLGESSQEIGNIVSLINDITDQTNILALNAAIQASMAGEAGRGFAVVADEVQRLAERSAFATKEIESLVKTIQSDTNEAVMSMEMTTTEVVRGAKLSKDAGVALEDIQKVSKHLAELILNISNAAKQQAVSASHVANTMNVIQEITTQTTSGTIEAARSVGDLAKMSKSLQSSVAGFKLPDA